VLDVARRTGGAVADVSDEEIVDAIGLLAATEGIFGETAVGVTLATTRRLLAAGELDPEAETVIVNSGDGLKTIDAIAPSQPTLHPIRPSLQAFAEFESAQSPRKAVA
jgi:threonine synthase